MKTFIFSYIISLSALIAVWLPDVLARPFHIIPRLAFYMAFPMALVVGFIIILLGSYFHILDSKTVSDALPSYGPAGKTKLNSESHAA